MYYNEKCRNLITDIKRLQIDVSKDIDRIRQLLISIDEIISLQDKFKEDKFNKLDLNDIIFINKKSNTSVSIKEYDPSDEMKMLESRKFDLLHELKKLQMKYESVPDINIIINKIFILVNRD